MAISSKRLGLSVFAMAAGLMLMGNIVSADPRFENTGQNVRDRGNATLTPSDQLENRRDRDITAGIRRSIIRNKSLSLNAHNAKIITRNGIVTLRGPVENFVEKRKLQSIAENRRGVRQVNNQLEAKRRHWHRR